jgi:uncharacterized protein YigE (DUF2233 family)
VPATAYGLHRCSFDPTREDAASIGAEMTVGLIGPFTALAEDLESKGKSLRFAMNSGMYRNDFRPVGRYVEDGEELTRLIQPAQRRSQPDTELL